jgi:hypothetical protein
MVSYRVGAPFRLPARSYRSTKDLGGLPRRLLGAILLLFFMSASATANAQPAGSYQKTCKNIIFTPEAGNSPSALKADCDNGSCGSGESTLYRIEECWNDISNDHGTLSCNRGSFRASCINIVVVGNDLSADCRDRAGKSQHATLSNKSSGDCLDVSNDNGNLMCKLPFRHP